MNKYYLGCLIGVFFVLVGLSTFRCVLEDDRVLMASDSNIGLLARSKALPLSSYSGFFFETPVHGSTGVRQPSLGSFLFYGSTIKFYNNWRYALYLVVASLALFGFIRLNGISRIGAVLGSLAAFWFGSITMVASGHDAKFATAMLFSIALLLVEKMVRDKRLYGRWLYAILMGGAVGCMLLEQQDVGLLFGLVLGAYALFRMAQQFKSDWKSWAVCLIPIALIGLLISGSTAIRSYEKNVSQAASMNSDREAKWNYITQWSLPPIETVDLIAPGFFGWKTGDAEAPYWGRCGQSAEWAQRGEGLRNFRLNCDYLGILPMALALLGLTISFVSRKNAERKSAWIWFWGIMALFLLLLSYGKYSPVYKMFYQLPLVNNIRVPMKFLQMLQVVIGLLCAAGWDGLRRQMEQRGKHRAIALFFFVLSAVFLLGSAYTYASQSDLVVILVDKGWGKVASLICSRMYTALMHSGLILLVAGGLVSVFWFRSSLSRKPWAFTCLGALFVLIFLFDVHRMTDRYFSAVSYKGLRRGNSVINYLKSQQGNERIFFFDSGSVYNQWLAIDVPYHQLNVFNIWQMPRMPGDYKAYLGSVGKDWQKLLQLASVKYALAPAGVLSQLPKDVFDPVMYYRFVREGEGIGTQQIMRPEHEQDQVMLLFKKSLPRFALFPAWQVAQAGQENGIMAATAFDPLKNLVVTQDEASFGLPLSPSAEASFQPCYGRTDGSTAELEVVSESGGVLLFTQHYQSGWRAFVDDEEVPLLHCNSISMGAYVPPGKHTVRFVCPKHQGFLIQTGVMGIVCLAGTMLMIRRLGRKGGIE